ncbi:hypothetical protein L6452_14867 [Arctium lappa]|uniref:Uncharacterized protein n=1 Tax=Arctium lappa TaxID=4217 RepID=A0ACB9CMA4_ARCLA|nr:hypothetical protein L6452_14867 [Arctium lappa]
MGFVKVPLLTDRVVPVIFWNGTIVFVGWEKVLQFPNDNFPLSSSSSRCVVMLDDVGATGNGISPRRSSSEAVIKREVDLLTGESPLTDQITVGLDPKVLK